MEGHGDRRMETAGDRRIRWNDKSGRNPTEAPRCGYPSGIRQSTFIRNCCRSTLWALQTQCSLGETAALLPAASTLAGGIAGQGETCGWVVGALMAIGIAFGPNTCPNPAADTRAREIGRLFVLRFLDKHGTTRCKDLQTQRLSGGTRSTGADPAAWREASRFVACAVLSGETARMAARLILEPADHD